MIFIVWNFEAEIVNSYKSFFHIVCLLFACLFICLFCLFVFGSGVLKLHQGEGWSLNIPQRVGEGERKTEKWLKFLGNPVLR